MRPSKVKQETTQTKQSRRPAGTPEAREKQLVAMAVDLAEKQLRDGTASSQVITHYLKIGSTREQLENELRVEQKKLMVAKTESLQSTQRIEELYADAIVAMSKYNGSDEGSSDD